MQTRSALTIRDEVGDFLIYDLEGEGSRTFVYRAEQMRLNRYVWLCEYVPEGAARTANGAIVPPDGTWEAFEAGRAAHAQTYALLESLKHAALPVVTQRFEAGGSTYAAMAYRDDVRSLESLLESGERFGEMQIGRFGLALGEALLLLESRGLWVERLEARNLLVYGNEAPLIAPWTEFLPEPAGDVVAQLGRVLETLARGTCERDGAPVEPGADRSRSLCAMINNMVDPDAPSRPATLAQAVTLLGSYRPLEDAPRVETVSRPSARIGAPTVRLAVIAITGAYLIYAASQPFPASVDALGWQDRARIEIAARLGNVDAQRALGRIYERGSLDGSIPEDALYWYRRAAENGDTVSQRQLGYWHATGAAGGAKGEGYAWFLKAAENGDAYAQHSLGMMYAFGRDVEKNDAKAQEWFQKAAAQEYRDAYGALGQLHRRAARYEEAMRWYLRGAQAGDAGAQTGVGYLFEMGQGVGQDYGEAFTWYSKAAKSGEMTAQYNLGLAYEYGRGTEQSSEQAKYWYKKALAQGYKAAEKRLVGLENKSVLKNVAGQQIASEKKDVSQRAAADNGTSQQWYERGRSHEKENAYEEALKFYLMAAEQGRLSAMRKCGYFYWKGRGVPAPDTARALEWFNKAAALGDGRSYYFLGIMRQNGDGVKRSQSEAAALFAKGAALGDSRAQYRLAEAYRSGKGVTRDLEEARAWYEKSAAQGYKTAKDKYKKFSDEMGKVEEGLAQWLPRAEAGEAQAQYEVGRLYGGGIGHDRKRAQEWYLKAAEQGHREAQRLVAIGYEYGGGVEQDDAKAFHWYALLARTGDADAQYMLGRHYLYGKGTDASPSTAVEWFERSAAQGNARAEHELGGMYALGQSVTYNPGKALEYYKTAASHRYGLAMYALGDAYERGMGTNVDLNQARAWFAEAAAQRVQGAAERLAAVERRLEH